MPEDQLYLRLEPGGALPTDRAFRPCRVVVVIESGVCDQWRNEVSDWLVTMGCLYMVVWGEGCSSWDDSVDWSNIVQWQGSKIPADRFVMTTWHEDESLLETMRFAKFLARHPDVQLEHTVILHISDQDKERTLLEVWRNA